jgi:hypothetical protein
MHHVGIEMTGGTGDDLHRGYATGANALGIVFRFQVTFHHADAELVSQGIDGGLQQGRLAGAGRRHEVDGQHPVLVEMPAVVQGLHIVLRSRRLSTVTRCGHPRCVPACPGPGPGAGCRG